MTKTNPDHHIHSIFFCNNKATQILLVISFFEIGIWDSVMEDRTRWGDVSAIYYLHFPIFLKERWNSELRLPTINYLFIVSRTRPKRLCQQSPVFWEKIMHKKFQSLFFWRRTIFKGYKFIFFIVNIIKY